MEGAPELFATNQKSQEKAKEAHHPRSDTSASCHVVERPGKCRKGPVYNAASYRVHDRRTSSSCLWCQCILQPLSAGSSYYRFLQGRSPGVDGGYIEWSVRFEAPSDGSRKMKAWQLRAIWCPKKGSKADALMG